MRAPSGRSTCGIVCPPSSPVVCRVRTQYSRRGATRLGGSTYPVSPCPASKNDGGGGLQPATPIGRLKPATTGKTLLCPGCQSPALAPPSALPVPCKGNDHRGSRLSRGEVPMQYRTMGASDLE